MKGKSVDEMKQVIVGLFQFGYETVEIVLRDGTGGEFYSCPEMGRSPRIKVGADGKWGDVVRILLHELLELAMFRQGCRYEVSGDVGQDMGAYVFMFTHAQFSNIQARAAEAIVLSLPAVSTAWRKWRRGKK